MRKNLNPSKIEIIHQITTKNYLHVTVKITYSSYPFAFTEVITAYKSTNIYSLHHDYRDSNTGESIPYSLQIMIDNKLNALKAKEDLDNYIKESNEHRSACAKALIQQN